MKEDTKMPVRCLKGDKLTKYKTFNSQHEFEALLEQVNKKPWTRKTGHHHPSQIGNANNAAYGCRRAMYYDRVGVPPVPRVTADKQVIFDMGHSLHGMIQDHFKKYEGFEEEVTCEFPDLHIYGHVDGVFWEEDWVLEIKTVGESVYRTLVQPKIEHVWQIHCYMFCLDIPRTQLFYINRANGSIRLFKVEFSNKIWEEITSVIGYIEDCVEKQEPPPQEISKWKCGGCKFYHECKPEFD